MTMMAETAMRQAPMTAAVYAEATLDELSGMLGIDRKQAGWQSKLAPFAPVWAAMIAASASDFASADAAGRIEK